MRLIICTFDATDRAEEVTGAVEALERRLGATTPDNIAIVQKTPSGEISFRETRDVRNELSEFAGTVVGGATWLVYSFVGLLGPVAGTEMKDRTANAVQRLLGDSGFPDDVLFEIGQSLDRGSSALLTLVPQEEVAAITAELQQLGGDITDHPVDPALLARLEQGDA